MTDYLKQAARKNRVSGVDITDIRPGMYVTLSPDNVTGDLSYTNEVLEVVANNSFHVQLRRITTESKDTIIVMLAHRDLYVATNFWIEN